jgi:hypothetical protein
MKCIWTVRSPCVESLVTNSQAHLICSLNPVLTMRFALSLKRSADPGGGEEWQLKHFSTVKFASGPSPDTQVSAVGDDIEMDHVE